MKKVLSLFFTFLFIFYSIIPTYAETPSWDSSPMTAQEAREKGFSWYQLPDGTLGLGSGPSASSSSYTGNDEVLVLPSSIDGKRVKEVGQCAFQRIQNYSVLIIPDSIISIADGAFQSCRFSSLCIGKNVTYIGNSAFRDNPNLTEVLIPENVSAIGANAFSDCTSLYSVTVNGPVKTIDAPFTGDVNLSSVAVNDCRADLEKIKEFAGSTYTGGAGATVGFSGHSLMEEWCEWTRTSGHTDEYGHTLWNGHFRHYRTAACSVCGLAYEFEPCDMTYPDYWTYSNTSVHIKKAVCSICGEEGTVTEEHDGYGPWTSSGSSTHKRTFNCSVCGRSGTQSGSHNLVTGQWRELNETKHVREKKCELCGYVQENTANHTYVYKEATAKDEWGHDYISVCNYCGATKREYEPHNDLSGDGFCDRCGEELRVTTFSVTLPVSLPIAMDENGNVYSSSDAKIVNASSGSVCVSAVEIVSTDGWKIVPYLHSMAGEKVDSDLIGFRIGSGYTKTYGYTEIIDSSGWMPITAGDELTIYYDAVVSACSSPRLDEEVLKVIFTVRWSE